MNDELPVRATITSSDGTASSMKIGKAVIIRDGVERVIFEDEITLSTNTIEGEKIENSSASISVPSRADLEPKIETKGNASVTNRDSIYSLEIHGKPKKLKIASRGGLFAVVMIRRQRNEGFSYFDVLFGREGESEAVDSSDKKNRPHISFHPDGNGKFIRLSNYRCTLHGDLAYDPATKSISPAKCIIEVRDFSERIVMNFEFNSEQKKVTLKEAFFESVND